MMHAKILVVDAVIGAIRIKTWFNELEQAIFLNVYFYRCITMGF